MNDKLNQENEHNAGDCSAREAASAESKAQPQPEKCVLDSLFSALRDGAEEAKNAAEKAIPKVKSAVADAAYWVGYGVSFAVVFPWTAAKNLTPECLKSGCHDGVKAGKEAAEKWVDRLRRRNEAASSNSSGLTGSVTNEAQPGTA